MNYSVPASRLCSGAVHTRLKPVKKSDQPLVLSLAACETSLTGPDNVVVSNGGTANFAAGEFFDPSSGVLVAPLQRLQDVSRYRFGNIKYIRKSTSIRTSGTLNGFVKERPAVPFSMRSLGKAQQQRSPGVFKGKRQGARYDKLKRRALLAPTGQSGINIAGGPELPPGVNIMEMKGEIKHGKKAGVDQIKSLINLGSYSENADGKPYCGTIRYTSGPTNMEQPPPSAAATARSCTKCSASCNSRSSQAIRSLHLSAASERSNSTQVEELLGSQGRMRRTTCYQSGWASTSQSQQRVFAPSTGRRASGVFKSEAGESERTCSLLPT
ncbi:hypothetical protein H4582DRAFT_2055554 [Lactarius indigo]|nr:hypothetical protein H4582DRAFT_2055554 [Lactarius indigo]